MRRGMRGTWQVVCPQYVAEAVAFWALHLTWAVMSAAGLASRVASNRENPGGSLSGRLQSRLAVGSVLLGCNRSQAAP